MPHDPEAGVKSDFLAAEDIKGILRGREKPEQEIRGRSQCSQLSRSGTKNDLSEPAANGHQSKVVAATAEKYAALD